MYIFQFEPTEDETKKGTWLVECFELHKIEVKQNFQHLNCWQAKCVGPVLSIPLYYIPSPKESG